MYEAIFLLLVTVPLPFQPPVLITSETLGFMKPNSIFPRASLSLFPTYFLALPCPSAQVQGSVVSVNQLSLNSQPLPPEARNLSSADIFPLTACYFVVGARNLELHSLFHFTVCPSGCTARC